MQYSFLGLEGWSGIVWMLQVTQVTEKKMQCSLLELKKHRNKCSAMLQLPYSTELEIQSDLHSWTRKLSVLHYSC